MSSRLTRVLAVLGAASILVVGVNAVSYATTGKPLLLGKYNSANATTTIKDTGSSSPLALLTKSSKTAPFKTNAKGKVVNLNADKLDGLDSTQLANVKAIRFKDSATSRSSNTTYHIGTVPKGTYLTTFDASLILATPGTPASPVTVSCFLELSIFDVAAQSSTVSIGDYNAAPSFSTVLTLNGTEDMNLVCGSSGSGGWSTSALFNIGEAPTLTFTRIDGVTSRVAAP